MRIIYVPTLVDHDLSHRSNLPPRPSTQNRHSLPLRPRTTPSFVVYAGTARACLPCSPSTPYPITLTPHHHRSPKLRQLAGEREAKSAINISASHRYYTSEAYGAQYLYVCETRRHKLSNKRKVPQTFNTNHQFSIRTCSATKKNVREKIQYRNSSLAESPTQRLT